MKVLVIGAGGQLGSDLVKVLSEEPNAVDVAALTHDAIEITDEASISLALETHRPDIVVNTAAFHKLEACEEDVETTFAVNAFGARNLALACERVKAALVFVSTDYVFGGDVSRTTPYQECDAPGPVNVYGVSKLAGECFIRYLMKRYWIIRVCGLYGIRGSSGKGGNFVELMLRLARARETVRVVNDQTLTPTYTVDVARQVKHLMRTESYGVYHATSHGQCSWYEFAAEIFRQESLCPNLEPASTPTAGAKVLRPRYSVLENAAMRRRGLDVMRPWQEALAAYLQERRLCGKP